jgi:hypothetical protein
VARIREELRRGLAPTPPGIRRPASDARNARTHGSGWHLAGRPAWRPRTRVQRTPLWRRHSHQLPRPDPRGGRFRCALVPQAQRGGGPFGHGRCQSASEWGLAPGVERGGRARRPGRPSAPARRHGAAGHRRGRAIGHSLASGPSSVGVRDPRRPVTRQNRADVREPARPLRVGSPLTRRCHARSTGWPATRRGPWPRSARHERTRAHGPGSWPANTRPIAASTPARRCHRTRALGRAPATRDHDPAHPNRTRLNTAPPVPTTTGPWNRRPPERPRPKRHTRKTESAPPGRHRPAPIIGDYSAKDPG